MASSAGAPPVFGGGDAPTSTPAATPSVPAAGASTTVTPTGPNSAGLNPGSVTTPSVPAPTQGANTGFQAIASQVVTGGGLAGVEPPTPTKPYTEKQLVTSLADALHVTAKKGEPLETAVVNELADKFGVKLGQTGETTSGTGTGQGTVGQTRHFIATFFDAWVGNAFNNNIATAIPTLKNAKTKEQIEALKAQALKIKNPTLQKQAMDKIATEEQQSSVSASLPQPVPAENAKALGEIITQVATKLGVQGAGPNALEDIAKSPQVNAQTATPASGGSAGSPQTYAQNYVAFTKAWTANKKLANGESFQTQWLANLENAGLLNADVNTATTSEQQNTVAKGGGSTLSTTTAEGPDEQQVFNAYQGLLVQSSAAKQSPQAFVTAAGSSPTTAALANGAPSEMYAFVQGVATEMGVGLTTAQLNQISNFYGASASTADDPTSVEDQIKDAVTALYDPTNPNNPPGVATTMFTNIQQAALQYQIPISSAQIGDMVKTTLQGATVESLYVAADAATSAATKQFQTQAAGLYPSLAPQIEQGQTVENLVAPYFNVAEAITGVPASTMTADVATGGVSKWGAFLQGGNNPTGSTQPANATGTAAKGQPQMMTMDQWKTYLMQTPSYGFQNTQGAKDMAEQMSSAILNEFGKVNTNGGSGQPFGQYNGQSDLSANTS